MSLVDSEYPENLSPIPTERDAYYRELTSRNHHFVSAETQQKLRQLRILVAGCGSTGGACIESLARLGVEHFSLADNGCYELTNLNRQHAFLDDLGRNKAEYHAEQVLRINPFARIQTHREGITWANVAKLTESADIIMDAVDVTTPSGIAMKLALHEQARAKKKPVLTALDIGFCQWGESYDYRNPRLLPLGGKLDQARAAKHPLKALMSFVPLKVVPAHAFGLLLDLLKNGQMPASQLGATSDLLSAIIVPAVIRFVETGHLINGWNFNLDKAAIPLRKRLSLEWKAIALRREIRKLLRTIE